MTTFLIILGLFLLGLTLVFAMDRDAFWQRLAGSPDMGPADLSTIGPAPRPNQAFAAPAGFNANRSPDFETKPVSLEPDQLFAVAEKALSELPGYKRLDDGNAPNKRRYLVRSPNMRFPDNIEIWALPADRADGGKTRYAVLARAQIGHSDMGANRGYVKRIMAAIESATGSANPQ